MKNLVLFIVLVLTSLNAGAVIVPPGGAEKVLDSDVCKAMTKTFTLRKYSCEHVSDERVNIRMESSIGTILKQANSEIIKECLGFEGFISSEISLKDTCLLVVVSSPGDNVTSEQLKAIKVRNGLINIEGSYKDLLS